jgi:3-hydroxyisobutyrate dehydrogenase
MKIAFLGTGLMGSLMAERLIQQQYDLIVWNRTTSKTEKLKQLGAEIASSPSYAIQKAELVITMLSDYVAVSSVLFEKEISYKNKTVIQMSTISPGESEILSERIQKSGGDYIEAPVLGGLAQIPEGKLLPMIGASEEMFVKWKPFLLNFAENVFYVGNVGKGAAAKLACNQLIASLLSAFSMSLGYLTDQGIDPELFMQVIRPSSYYVPAFDRKKEAMISGDYSNTNFPLKHLLKDVKLVIDNFGNSNVNVESLIKVKEILEQGVKSNLGNLDYSALHQIIYKNK